MSDDILPRGWATTSLGELIDNDGIFIDGDWVESKDQDPNGDVRLVQLADIGDGVYRNKSNRFLTFEKAIQLGCTFLKADDVLIARMPNPLGRTCIFPGNSKPCVTVVDVCIVRASSRVANNRWLMYTINSPVFRSKIADLQSGSTRKRISRSNLAKLVLPLPPLPEQCRIVAKIEELFTRLDAGVEALKKTQAQLKRYRQSVLKYACEGKLVPTEAELARAEGHAHEPADVLLARILKERREKRKEAKDKEHAAPDTSGLPELLEGWCYANVGELIEPSSEKIDPLKIQEMPYIGLEHIEKDTGKLLGYGRSNEVRSTKTRFYSGDLLYGKLRPYLNKVYVADFDGVCSTDILVFSRSPYISNKYLSFRFLCGDFVRYASQNISGVQHPRVDFKALSKFTISLPPFAEQRRIVAEVERRLSIAEGVERTVEQSLRQAERLRQSILKRAFEGRLVPQNPEDEPASVLLERIKAERARMVGKRRKALLSL